MSNELLELIERTVNGRIKGEVKLEDYVDPITFEGIFLYAKIIGQSKNATDLSRLIGVNPSHISRILSGKIKLTGNRISETYASADIALGLSVDIDPRGRC